MQAESRVAVVLRELADAASSGTVHVASVLEQGSVRLRDGLVVDAEAPSGTVPLGLALVGAGALSAPALRDVLDGHDPLSEASLADVLVDCGAVSRADVADVVRRRLGAAVGELLMWPGATWERDEADPVADGLVAIDVQTLLAAPRDAIPAPDEAPTIDDVPAIDDVPSPCEWTGALPLTLAPQAWSLLCAVDGRRTIADLSRLCDLGLHRTAALVAELAAVKVVQVRAGSSLVWAPRVGPADPALSPAGTLAPTAAVSVAIASPDTQAERIAVWRRAAVAEARALSAEHALMSMEFAAYEEDARRESAAQTDRATRLAAKRTLAEIAAYVEAERRVAEPVAYAEQAHRQAEQAGQARSQAERARFAEATRRRVAAEEAEARRTVERWQGIQAQRRVVVAEALRAERAEATAMTELTVADSRRRIAEQQAREVVEEASRTVLPD